VAVCIGSCSTTPDVPDAAPADAGLDKKTMPLPDAGDAEAAAPNPMRLSETGLYSDFPSRTLAPGIIQYVPRWPLWSDGASKKRYLLLPPSSHIDTTSMDDWIFPVGTKVWKEFDVGTTVVETRLLWKTGDNLWWEVAYAWLADGSDAIAEPDGGANALGTTHDIPSQTDCNACHSNVRDVLIGVSAMQLGASDGDGTLAAFLDAGLLTTSATPPYDVPGTGTTKDALGYLHGNCGHCHNAISAIDKQTPMRLRILTTDTVPNQTQTYTTSRCLVMKHVIPPNIVYALDPSSPDASGIPVRMNRRDPFGMPPNCTKAIDDAGVATVTAWVASMPADAGCD
jgi:hypothetical protein